jgi:hypothetical protein
MTVFRYADEQRAAVLEALGEGWQADADSHNSWSYPRNNATYLYGPRVNSYHWLGELWLTAGLDEDKVCENNELSLTQVEQLAKEAAEVAGLLRVAAVRLRAAGFLQVQR